VVREQKLARRKDIEVLVKEGSEGKYKL